VIGWPSYNRPLAKRGEILFLYDFLDGWDYELERMNKNKKGKPFTFPNSFILAAVYIRYSFHLPYRQTEVQSLLQEKSYIGTHQAMVTSAKESTS
jgi:hypothetical protein